MVSQEAPEHRSFFCYIERQEGGNTFNGNEIERLENYEGRLCDRRC